MNGLLSEKMGHLNALSLMGTTYECARKHKPDSQHKHIFTYTLQTNVYSAYEGGSDKSYQNE